MNTNTKSQLAEIKVAANLAERGYTVSIPVGVAPYDLIVDRDGRLSKIQVKYAELKDGGSIPVKLERTRVTSAGTIRATYNKNEIDFVAVYCGNTDTVYYVPACDVAGKTYFALRAIPAKNGQIKNINFAESYIQI